MGRIFGNAVNRNVETQHGPHLATDRHAPLGFAFNFMLAAALGALALVFFVAGGAGWDITGNPWFALLFVPGIILMIGVLGVAILTLWEIGLRYPKVPEPPPPMELPRPKPARKPRTFTFRHKDGSPPEELPIDEPPKKLPGFELTEEDLRAFVSRACEFGLSRPNMVPDGHKIQLPSGDELSRTTYDRVIDHMATLGWVEKRGKGQSARWAVTRRELPRLIDEVTWQAGR